jgi:hypothetical protein
MITRRPNVHRETSLGRPAPPPAGEATGGLHNIAHLIIGPLLVFAATKGEAVSSRVDTVVGGRAQARPRSVRSYAAR